MKMKDYREEQKRVIKSNVEQKVKNMPQGE